MARPAVTATTEREYGRLPEHYRDADVGNDWDLLAYMASTTDQIGEVEAMVDRLDRPGGGSDLFDADAADVEWLAYVAQIVGVNLNPALSEMEKRDAIRFSSAGWRAGTKTGMADAARSALTGTKYVTIYDHSTDVSVIGAATQWDVLVVTRVDETPSAPAVLAAIVAKGAKPAGVKLWHRSYTSTWAQQEAAYPTWAGREAAGTWQAIEEVGL
jgi:hypothetical protein